MAYRIHGRGSATMHNGLAARHRVVCLDALAVVCHGWRSPARGADCRRSARPGGWINPLRSWTRPVRRAA